VRVPSWPSTPVLTPTERVHEYLETNASFDWGQLQDIWSGAPEAVFFNLNGHTYKGREQWTRLWQFYQPNVRSAQRGCELYIRLLLAAAPSRPNCRF
jgi:hypothetical protein